MRFALLLAVGVAVALSAQVAGAKAPPAATVPKYLGAVVVSARADLDKDARALARSVYRKPGLRPGISDSMARVVLGLPPGAKASAGEREVAQVVAAARASTSDLVRTRLLLSLAADVSAGWLVWVDKDKGSVFARLLDVRQRRFRQVMLTPKAKEPSNWSDAVGILAGLNRGVPLPGPRSKTTNRAPVGLVLGSGKPPADGDRVWWKSPFFWSGLGAVVVVGVTVLVLSQTGTTESDTVVLSGRVPQ